MTALLSVADDITRDLNGSLDKTQLPSLTSDAGSEVVQVDKWMPPADRSTATITETASPRETLRRDVEVPRVFRMPQPEPRRRAHTETLAQWEGTVTAVIDDQRVFVASLAPLSGAGGEEQEATIDFDEITPDDFALLRPGAVFYWSIGYEVSVAGTRRRLSTIRFRRLPAWSAHELDALRQRTNRLASLFGIDE